MPLNKYINAVSKRYQSGISTEHSYRGDLQNLLENIDTTVSVTNEPARIKCGAPDYIITRKDIPVGYIEAKDIGKPLNSKDYKEQFDRYKKSLNNLIITDYLEFQLFIDGEFKTSINIGEIDGNRIVPKTENFPIFISLIKNFYTHKGQTITSALKLSTMMADKARMLEQVIEAALISDEESNANTELKGQMKAFKTILIHDITPKGFADIYAQTIAYGMFAARLHDPTLENFTRKEAGELIPKSNPFLRKLFQYIAANDLDDRIAWIVDALADIFSATNVTKMLRDFGKSTQRNDPIIHFYETFLAEYDPALRKSRGVWYTPEPVVNFIVRAVDDILKTEFELPQGLADTSKTTIKVKQQGTKSKTLIEKEVHRVQILDPATGTGTFLAEVIKQVHEGFKGQEGIWSGYVDEHLVPRLNGFEILMASYAMAHLKLDLLLRETGYKPKKEQRLQVYLTNSLEEDHPDTGTLFAQWLSSEANEANHIKRDTPVMVVLGNPPYSGVSTNNGDWITNLIEDYKYVNGEHFGERKHWLQDDYVKFIRYGEHFIEKNGEGILAYITNHKFLDNITFRGMRWHLLKTFDKIYILDLHGDTENEISPDGSKDENVFNIQQGVSINIFVKTGKKKKNELAEILHNDLWGSRNLKFETLWNNELKELVVNKVDVQKPLYFFVPKNFEGSKQYESGFKINELFPNNVTGIVTMGDSFIIAESKKILEERLKYFKENDVSEDWLNKEFGLGKNYAEWILNNKASIKIEDSKFTPIDYRPFDIRWTYFDNKLLWRWRVDTMQHFINSDNVGLMTCRQTAIDNWEHVGITKFIADDSRVSNRSKERGYIFPLYIYPDAKQQTLGGDTARTPNLDMGIVEKIAKKLKLQFTPEKETTKNTFAPIDILDYIYAVLHSPAYRERYKEFLKIDFPRVPYPTDAASFWQLVALGGELRQIHLLESPVVAKYITTYPVTGSNEVEKIRYEGGKVYINDEQYFDKVPQTAWEFYIGGYQPAQKWLKDRRGRTLSFDDILHYQKVIVALSETDRIMKGIDGIISI